MTVAEANSAYEAAARALCEAARREYPVGTIVDVTFGRVRVTGEVTGHSSIWWRQPGKVFIRNIKTNKARHFEAAEAQFKATIVGRG